MFRDYFFELADKLTARLRGDEVLLCSLTGEDSDFVRLNRNRIRQAGSVQQRVLSLDLIKGRRHAAGQLGLSGHMEQDTAQAAALMESLRAQRPHLPEDPYLHYATEVRSTEQVHDHALPPSDEALDQIMRAAEGMDLVGIWANGTTFAGFANSLGQRNWHSSATFNFDWSCHHVGDKAVKNGYAGSRWQLEVLLAKMEAMRAELELMQRPPKTIAPGRYRVYLAPAALREILDMLAWGGFGLKSHRTAQTPLIKMVREGRRLHPSVTLLEHGAAGFGPMFTPHGFIKPDHVVLIKDGAYGECLADPRAAKEYGVAVNSAGESPEAFDMAPGTLARSDVPAALDTGLYINNLWYCNFSDRSNCRITGMTRFACFWVENGRITAPVNVMRFDESVYHILGGRLLGLTRERELILDSGTYGQRSLQSYHLPGALVDGFTFTL